MRDLRRLGVHEGQRRRRQHIRWYRFWVRRHDFPRLAIEQAWLHVPTQVAIGNDAYQGAALINHSGVSRESTVFAGCHGDKNITHRSIGLDERQFLFLVHNVADADELLAQRAAWMKVAILLGGKSASLHQ